jgi:uncharacterized protein
MTRIVYLHGFASGAQSTKARFFAAKFAEMGVPFEAPQLDQGDFQALTVTRALDVVDRASLGGYLAAAYAARHPEIEKAVLLAPAFQFPTRWRARFSSAELEAWRRTGSHPFYHYSFKAERPLGYAFVEDAIQYEDEPAMSQSALVLHGLRDEVVPAEVSREFASRRQNVVLKLVESGHELTDVLDILWAETGMFLGFQKR